MQGGCEVERLKRDWRKEARTGSCRRGISKLGATAKAVRSYRFSGRRILGRIGLLRTAKAVATHRFSGTTRLI
jgi:hypothetical protein